MKHTRANIIFSGKSFEHKSRRKQVSLLTLQMNMVQEVLARAIRQEKEIRDIKIGKGKIKLP